jgi:hypothetical protein
LTVAISAGKNEPRTSQGGMSEADQYWRSRTINEAQLQGYTGLKADL